MMKYYDFRSDTVTKPTDEMREAMAKAEVGDDVYSEDPTVNRLQTLAAERMGKEAGLFVTSGTMGNLIAVLAQCQRGDEVIMGTKGHTFLFEVGGISALGGVFPHTIPNQDDGTLLIEDIRTAIRPNDVHHPISRMVILENTQNRCGGVALTPEYTRQVAELAHRNNMALHLDGARIFNAAAGLNVPIGELVRDTDTVTFCLSKGLCAPVGSVLCGSNAFVEKARKIRKQLGGGMRQAGIIAAAGVVALEKMTSRLGEDHVRAHRLAEGLKNVPGLHIDMNSPQTNMIFVSINQQYPLTALEVSVQLKDKGILVGVVAERQFRLVLHYWINDAAIDACIDAFKTVMA